MNHTGMISPSVSTVDPSGIFLSCTSNSYPQNSSYQPQSYQPQSYQPQQTYRDPMAGVDQDFWNLRQPQAGSGSLIYGFFLLGLIGGAIWLFVAILPFLMAVLGFLFSAALIVGAIIGGLWVFVTIMNAIVGEQKPPQ